MSVGRVSARSRHSPSVTPHAAWTHLSRWISGRNKAGESPVVSRTSVAATAAGAADGSPRTPSPFLRRAAAPRTVQSPPRSHDSPGPPPAELQRGSELFAPPFCCLPVGSDGLQRQRGKKRKRTSTRSLLPPLMYSRAASRLKRSTALYRSATVEHCAHSHARGSRRTRLTCPYLWTSSSHSSSSSSGDTGVRGMNTVRGTCLIRCWDRIIVCDN